MANENVWCEINEFGHLLTANNRFCRMFGFAENEIPWHYIKDLYRYPQDWETFKKHSPEDSARLCFFVRLKNRAGRSYKCSMECLSRQNDNGSWIHRIEIAKVDSAEELGGSVSKDFRSLTCAV